MNEISEKIVYEIYNEIENKNNLVNLNAIPQSDEFVKYLVSLLGISEGYVKESIHALMDSNKLFSLEIVAEDPAHNVQRVEGYVVADKEVISKLKNYFQDQLVSVYEAEHYKRLSPHVIIKEIMPIIRSLNSTEIGKITNKAMMLEQFEKIVERDELKFLRSNQDRFLSEIIADKNLMAAKAAKKKEEEQKEINSIAGEPVPVPDSIDLKKTTTGQGFTRAVDTEEYSDFDERSAAYPLSKILSIYGVEFFFRVKFRKCEFNYLKKILEDGQITKYSDLNLIKEMLKKVRKNISSDPNLRKHQLEIYALERAIGQAMYYAKR